MQGAKSETAQYHGGAPQNKGTTEKRRQPEGPEGQVGGGAVPSLQRESPQRLGPPAAFLSPSVLPHPRCCRHCRPFLPSRPRALQAARCTRLSLPFCHLCHVEVPSPPREPGPNQASPTWPDEARRADESHPAHPRPWGAESELEPRATGAAVVVGPRHAQPWAQRDCVR